MTSPQQTVTSDIWDIFRTGGHHTCCDCCDDICGVWLDDGPVHSYLCTVDIHNHRYLTDRYVAIDANLVTVPDDTQHSSSSPSTMTIPDAKPGPSADEFTPSIAVKLLDAGIDVCHGEPKGPQHLYYGGRHVGWIMAAPGGPTLEQIRRLHNIRRDWRIPAMIGDDLDETGIDSLARIVQAAPDITETARQAGLGK